MEEIDKNINPIIEAGFKIIQDINFNLIFDSEQKEESLNQAYDEIIDNLEKLELENLLLHIHLYYDKLSKKKSSNLTDINIHEQEYIEKILDLLMNKLINTDTFKGISYSQEDIRFRNIIRDFEDDVIKMPTFQRKYVWDKKRAAELITSLVYGIPIPPIYSYEIENENTRYIIDGQQRITSLLFFYYKAFPKSLQNRISYNKEIFKPIKKINTLEDKKDKEYIELEKKIKDFGVALNVDFPVRMQNGQIMDLTKVNEQIMNTILNRNVNIITIKSADKVAMAHIFNIYNTGGIKLTENQIRKAIYANNDIYKTIIYISNPKQYRKEIEVEDDKNFYNIEDFQRYNLSIKKILGNKDIEESIFRILSFNFNVNYGYSNSKYFRLADDSEKSIINKMKNNSFEDLIKILNSEINYAKGKIHSIIDEYSNYISTRDDFVKNEIKKLINFIKMIENSKELHTRTQYHIKNITCIYIILDFFKKLDIYDENLILHESYFIFEEPIKYATLEQKRLNYFYNLLKDEGVI